MVTATDRGLGCFLAAAVIFAEITGKKRGNAVITDAGQKREILEGNSSPKTPPFIKNQFEGIEDLEFEKKHTTLL